METLRTIVVDDDKPARARLCRRLARSPSIEVVGQGGSGHDAIALVRAYAPHLLILDVQMPDLDGFAVIDAIAPDAPPAVIFVSANDDEAIELCETHALDYLVRPFSDARLEAMLRRVCRLIHSRPDPLESDPRLAGLIEARRVAAAAPAILERLLLKTSGRIIFLKVEDIDWIEACGVYVYLHVGPSAHLYRSSLTQLLKRLDPARFVRVHRRSAVNTDRIRELLPRSHGDYTIVLHDDTALTMSRGYRPEVEQWLRQKL